MQEVYTEVPDNVTDETMKDFISSYKSGISDATGVCAKLTQELEDLETQDKLITMINAASEGMAKTRRDVSNIKLEEDDDAWSKVCAIVERTRPFVVAYKKHTRAGQSLTLGCMPMHYLFLLDLPC